MHRHPTLMSWSGNFVRQLFSLCFKKVPLLLLASLILDNGQIFKRVAIASVAYWIFTLMVLIRRSSNIHGSDVLLVKWGYLPTLFATWIIELAVSAIWLAA